MLLPKIQTRWSVPSLHLQPIRLPVATRWLILFGVLCGLSVMLGLQPEWRADNGAALGYAPLMLPTPETLAIARAAPRAPATREVYEASSAQLADSLFDVLTAPLVREAQRRRADTARRDPEFVKRIDLALNEHRINVLLFGYGETHEPPFTERAIIGSHTLVSYDTRTHQADIISFTHDIRAPEIEREVIKRGGKPPALRMDNAYNVGGFHLQRKMIENATGLAVDYQIVFRDVVLQRLIDDVFEGIEVNVPMAFDVHPFYLDGVKYPAGHFAQGVQKLNGRQAIQFIKTVPVAEGEYDKVLEHNARKAQVFQALLRVLNEKSADRAFWLKSAAFITREFLTGAVVCDFDALALLVNTISNATTHLPATNARADLPTIRRSLYIVDAAHGDGGVQWVNANAAENPITQKDIEAGVYITLAMEVPLNANPYGDLVTGYWTSVRALVKETLLNSSPASSNARGEEGK
jgi:hypothetical protein